MRTDHAWSHLWWHLFLNWRGFLIQTQYKDWMIDWSTLSSATLLCAAYPFETNIKCSSNQSVQIYYGRYIFCSAKNLQISLYTCIYIHRAKSVDHSVELDFSNAIINTLFRNKNSTSRRKCLFNGHVSKYFSMYPFLETEKRFGPVK